MAKNNYDWEEEFFEEDADEQEFSLKNAEDITDKLSKEEKEKEVVLKKKKAVEKIIVPYIESDKRTGTLTYYVLENLYLGSSENTAKLSNLEFVLDIIEKENKKNEDIKLVLGGNLIARKNRKYEPQDIIKTLAKHLAPHADKIILAINGPEEDEYKRYQVSYKYETEIEYESINPITNQVEIKRKKVTKVKKQFIDPMFELLQEIEKLWNLDPKNAGKPPLNLLGKYTNSRSKTIHIQFVDPKTKRVVYNHFRTFKSIKTNSLNYGGHGRIVNQTGELQKVDAVHCTCSNHTFRKSTGTYQASKEKGEEDVDEFAPKEVLFTSGLMEFQRMPGNAQDKNNAVLIRKVKLDCFKPLVERAEKGVRKTKMAVVSSLIDLRPALFFNTTNKSISEKYAYQLAYNEALESKINEKLAQKREEIERKLIENSIKERNEMDQILINKAKAYDKKERFPYSKTILNKGFEA